MMMAMRESCTPPRFESESQREREKEEQERLQKERRVVRSIDLWNVDSVLGVILLVFMRG